MTKPLPLKRCCRRRLTAHKWPLFVAQNRGERRWSRFFTFSLAEFGLLRSCDTDLTTTLVLAGSCDPAAPARADGSAHCPR